MAFLYKALVVTVLFHKNKTPQVRGFILNLEKLT